MSSKLRPGTLLKSRIPYTTGMPHWHEIPSNEILIVLSDIFFDDQNYASLTLLSCMGIVTWKRGNRIQLEDAVLNIHVVLNEI